MKIVKNIFHSAMTSWLNFAVTIITGLLMVPLMIRYLGDSLYGVWIFLNSIFMYLNIMHFGMGSSIVKYVSEAKGRNDNEEQNNVVNVIFFSYTWIAVTIFFVFLFLVLLAPGLFSREDIRTMDLQIISIILVFNLCVSLPLSSFGGVIMGYQRFDIVNLINTVNTLARFLLIWIFLRKGAGVITIAAITLISSLSEGLLTYIYSKKLFPAFRFAYRYLTRDNLRKILAFSGFSFISNIMDNLIYQTDYIVIGIFSTSSDVVNFSIPNRFVQYFRTIALQFFNVLIPTVSELEARNETEKIREITVQSIKYSYVFCFLIGTILLFFGDEMTEIWVGGKYVWTIGILIALTISHIVTIPLNIYRIVLWGLAKIKVPTILTTLEGLTNVILSVILIKSMGIMGVALGTAIAQIVFKGIVLPIYSVRQLRIEIDGQIMNIVFRLIIVAAAGGALNYLYSIIHPLNGLYLFTAAGIVLNIAVYSAMTYTVLLNRAEKEKFHSILRNRLKTGRRAGQR